VEMKEQQNAELLQANNQIDDEKKKTFFQPA
jgi:hypothetical protein